MYLLVDWYTQMNEWATAVFLADCLVKYNWMSLPFSLTIQQWVTVSMIAQSAVQCKSSKITIHHCGSSSSVCFSHYYSHHFPNHIAIIDTGNMRLIKVECGDPLMAGFADHSVFFYYLFLFSTKNPVKWFSSCQTTFCHEKILWYNIT